MVNNSRKHFKPRISITMQIRSSVGQFPSKSVRLVKMGAATVGSSIPLRHKSRQLECRHHAATDVDGDTILTFYKGKLSGSTGINIKLRKGYTNAVRSIQEVKAITTAKKFLV